MSEVYFHADGVKVYEYILLASIRWDCHSRLSQVQVTSRQGADTAAHMKTLISCYIPYYPWHIYLELTLSCA